MERIIKNKIGVETKIFAQTFEFEAYGQIKNLCNFEPYQNSKIRVMPDAHAGKGCVVGTTMTITDKVTPNLVGVDIGCGMLTTKLHTKIISFHELDEIIRNEVPSGFDVHSSYKHKFDFDNLRCKKHVDIARAYQSIGTLGGGNHFIEVDIDDYGNLYLIIHSGSRKLGVDVCKYYQNMAFKNANEHVSARAVLIRDLKAAGREKDIEREVANMKKQPADKELAFLSGSDFDDYMNDMKIVQQFAEKNRTVMANTILKKMKLNAVENFQTIHNYIDFKRKILRKGAVSAEAGEKILIPINMRDGSLVCVGKGNPEWNYSAPHGAGRLMSRSKAKEEINLEDFEKSMKGIFTTSVSKDTIDESPMAYKNIDEIVSSIGDTVRIIDRLEPVYNFKAH